MCVPSFSVTRKTLRLLLFPFRYTTSLWTLPVRPGTLLSLESVPRLLRPSLPPSRSFPLRVVSDPVPYEGNVVDGPGRPVVEGEYKRSSTELIYGVSSCAPKETRCVPPEVLEGSYSPATRKPR